MRRTLTAVTLLFDAPSGSPTGIPGAPLTVLAKGVPSAKQPISGPVHTVVVRL
jgi:hypothetical protein